MKRIVVAGVLTLLASCQWVPGTTAHKVEAAKTIVREELVDGASAQFEDVVVSGAGAGPAMVCGWVNSKNRMGGYTGAVKFLVSEGRVRQLGAVRDEAYSGKFGACVAGHKAATDRMRRDGDRALDAYEAAVSDLKS